MHLLPWIFRFGPQSPRLALSIFAHFLSYRFSNIVVSHCLRLNIVCTFLIQALNFSCDSYFHAPAYNSLLLLCSQTLSHLLVGVITTASHQVVETDGFAGLRLQ